MTNDIPRDETGQPNLYAKTPEKRETFNIDDRSKENQQRAHEELKREFGPGYQAAKKNAKAVLSWADEEYPQSLEKSGLGNYPPLIKALNKLGKELEEKYKEANKSGSMRKAMVKAFEAEAREKINHLIMRVEAEYIKKHGAISR